MKTLYVCADCGYSHFYSFGSECPSCGSHNLDSNDTSAVEALFDEMTEDDISGLIARELKAAGNE